LNHTFVQLATLMDSAISIADAASFRHIGSVGWKIASGAIFWSKEAYRVPDIDRGEKATIDLLLQRVHPDDRAILQARGGSSVEARQALVVVRGSGIGLEPAASARLFTPFFTTRDGGMGMGLSICRSIVEVHGGRIWAMSNDGPEATFRFALPLQAENAA